MSSILDVKTAPKIKKVQKVAKVSKTTRPGGSTIRYGGGR